MLRRLSFVPSVFGKRIFAKQFSTFPPNYEIHRNELISLFKNGSKPTDPGFFRSFADPNTLYPLTQEGEKIKISDLVDNENSNYDKLNSIINHLIQQRDYKQAIEFFSTNPEVVDVSVLSKLIKESNGEQFDTLIETLSEAVQNENYPTENFSRIFSSLSGSYSPRAITQIYEQVKKKLSANDYYCIIETAINSGEYGLANHYATRLLEKHLSEKSLSLYIETSMLIDFSYDSIFVSITDNLLALQEQMDSTDQKFSNNFLILLSTIAPDNYLETLAQFGPRDSFVFENIILLRLALAKDSHVFSLYRELKTDSPQFFCWPETYKSIENVLTTLYIDACEVHIETLYENLINAENEFGKLPIQKKLFFPHSDLLAYVESELEPQIEKILREYNGLHKEAYADYVFYKFDSHFATACRELYASLDPMIITLPGRIDDDEAAQNTNEDEDLVAEDENEMEEDENENASENENENENASENENENENASENENENKEELVDADATKEELESEAKSEGEEEFSDSEVLGSEDEGSKDSEVSLNKFLEKFDATYSVKLSKNPPEFLGELDQQLGTIGEVLVLYEATRFVLPQIFTNIRKKVGIPDSPETKVDSKDELAKE